MWGCFTPLRGKIGVMSLVMACVFAGLWVKPFFFPLEPGIPWRRVHYGDLDLTRDAGVAALYARIRAAAQTVCPPQTSWADKWVEHAESCRFQAVARAVAEVNSPGLTSYYEAKMQTR